KAAKLKSESFFDPSVVAAFDSRGERVAVGRAHDIALWSTVDGTEIGRHVVDYPIVDLFFHESGNILIVVGATDSASSTASLIDLATGRMLTFNLNLCRDVVPCIGEGVNPAGRIADIRNYAQLADLLSLGGPVPADLSLLVPHKGASQDKINFSGTAM